MNIGFIGYGEAAFCITQGFKEIGVTGIVAYDAMMNHEVMGTAVRNRAEQAGVKLLHSAKEVVEFAEVLFAAVPSSYTLDVCNEIKDVLKKGQIYADVSASTPKVKEKIWEEIKDKGVLFVDAAMLGSLPQDKHKVPITASGNGAMAFKEKMEPLEMRISFAGDKAGAASAIKLMRSVYMKGIACLMVEMLEGCEKYDISEDVIKSIGKSMDQIPFEEHLNRLVIGSALHGVRRAAELKGSVAMLDECGLHYAMTEASKATLERLGEKRFAEKYLDKRPSGWKEIITALDE